ncbi:MAG: diacylglycerol kinase [Pirellulales bacterium]|nr:diacylglycerol kinase [Pirellulales bacterium]
MSNMPERQPERSWSAKFGDAFRGLKQGVRGQSSFFVHFFVAAAVVVAGLGVGVSRLEWCVLVLCMTIVLSAEMFNSALESMARAVTRQHDTDLGGALDIGSAAVLLASIGAAVVGLLILGQPLATLLGWWPAG